MNAPETSLRPSDEPAAKPQFAVSSADLEQHYAAELAAASDARAALQRLMQLHRRCDRPDLVVACLKRLLPLAQNAEQEARWRTDLGGCHERFGDYRGASAHYRRALALEPADSVVCYFATNNLACCLNAAGRFADAEFYARQAIATDPSYHNAHKNPGSAPKGQGRLTDAAEAFIAATDADPTDGRACALLACLLEEHPHLAPTFEARLETCRRVVHRVHRAVAEQTRANLP